MRFLTNTKNKRQGNTAMVIPCLCSFLLTVPSSAFSELPVNKKYTRTLFRKESGSYDLGRHSYGSGNRGLSNSPTGLIAYSADWRRQSRPVRVLYRPALT